MSAARSRMPSLGCTILALTVAAVTPKPCNASGRGTEQRILSRMHRIDQIEIEMGEIAARKGLSQQVKDFGRTLQKDHQKNDANVVSLARDEGLSLTLNHRLVDQTITDFERRTRNRLESASSADFDRVFLKAMAKGQAQTLRLLTHARDRLDDGPVRSFVISTIPAIRRHRELAETLQAKV